MKSVVWGRNSTLILNNLCLNFLYYCLENGRKDHYKSSFIEHFCLVALRNTEGMRKIIDLVFLPWGATFNRHWWTYKQSYNAVSSVQSLSRVWLFATPWTAAHQASLSITNSQSIPKLRSIESVMPSNHLILCCPFLLPSIFPSIRVSSNELALHIRWLKYWSFSIKSFQWIFRVDFPLGLTGLISLQSKRLSRVFSNTIVKNINSLALSLLYGPTLVFIHDYWKNHSFDYVDLHWQSNVSAF